MNLPNRRPLFCLITDRKILKANSEDETADALAALCARAARAGVDLIQIREKDMPTNRLCALVEAVLKATEGTGAKILVNDRADAALACGAHGVHLPSDSIPIDAARRFLGDDLIIGVSTHSIEEAVQAGRSGADYALFGPVFDTPSKRAYGPPLGLDKLEDAVRSARLPILALGGIDASNIKDALERRAAGIAAIRLFVETEDLDRLIRTFRDN